MTDAVTLELNEQVVEDFTSRLLKTVNEGSLALMLSIGHRTGLFDTMAKLPPGTSRQIADAAGLDERYVREWLGAMVVGQVVRYNATTRLYQLPAEHAARLTRAAMPNNLAGMMQWFAVLGGVEDDVVSCFRHGGGVPYERYARFHEVMAEESAQTTVAGLDEHILPSVPGLIERLEAGIDVLDIGCGRGWAMMHLAQRFPNSRFSGYDLSPLAIADARREARERGLTNVRFESRDVTHLHEPAQFDLITAFDAIHDQMHPDQVLRNIEAALRPGTGSIFLMQDIHASSHVHKNVNHPLGTLLYTISCMHCMTVSLAGGGCGLGACWGKELALKMLDEAGFGHVTVQQLEHDILNSYYIIRKR